MLCKVLNFLQSSTVKDPEEKVQDEGRWMAVLELPAGAVVVLKNGGQFTSTIK